MKARAKRRLVSDWGQVEIVKPTFLGTRVLENYDINRVIPYIDWDPFFQTWQLRGKYPNRTYPKIFNDKTVGEQAKELFEKGQTMLKDIIDNKLI